MAMSEGVVGQLALLFGGCCARVKSTPSSPRAKAAEPAELEETQLKLPDDDLPAQILSARRASPSMPCGEECKDVDVETPGDGSCSTIYFVHEACEQSIELDASWTSGFLLAPESTEDGLQEDAVFNYACPPVPTDADETADVLEGVSDDLAVDAETLAVEGRGNESCVEAVQDTSVRADEDVADMPAEVKEAMDESDQLSGSLIDLNEVASDGADGQIGQEADMHISALLEARTAEGSIALDEVSFHDCLELLEALDTSTESGVCGFQDALEGMLSWRFITSRTGNKTIGEKEFLFFEECLRGLNESIAYYGMDAPLHEMDLYEAEETVRYMVQEWFRRTARQGGDSLFVERRRFMSFGSMKVLELFIWCAPVEQMYLSVEWPWNVRVESA